MADVWRRCSACKQDIALDGVYYTCSVSTCNRVRTALAFCSVTCWEIHLPTERHREAWAIERRAPAKPEPIHQAVALASRRAAVATDDREILVVASKIKAYIRARAGYNTSDGVMPVLSDAIRKLCDEAIRNARRAERRTVMNPDIPRDGAP